MKLYKTLICLALLVVSTTQAQQRLSLNDVQKHTHYFSISEQYEFSENIKDMLAQGAKESQFVGIAEVHQSEQLSHFTAAFLHILKANQYHHFALELGDYATSILEDISKNPSETKEKLKALNKTYGKKRFPYVPFIFVDKVADVKFIEEASKLEMNLWGIDREYEFSYVLHFDKMYALSTKTPAITTAYENAKKVLKKYNFKDKVSGEPKYCWLLSEPSINKYLTLLSEDEKLKKYADELRNSWGIYCRFAQGKGGSTARATYMRRKFDSLYTIAAENEKLPKVLVKLGGVHLTHGNSIYGRFDVGRHLHEKAKENNTNFLAIRHVWRYKDGKDQVGKSGWKNTRFLMQLGKKDQWTLIDLRPIKKLVAENNLQIDKGTAWELANYDWFLISPNDSKGSINR